MRSNMTKKCDLFDVSTDANEQKIKVNKHGAFLKNSPPLVTLGTEFPNG